MVVSFVASYSRDCDADDPARLCSGTLQIWTRRSGTAQYFNVRTSNTVMAQLVPHTGSDPDARRCGRYGGRHVHRAVIMISIIIISAAPLQMRVLIIARLETNKRLSLHCCLHNH